MDSPLILDPNNPARDPLDEGIWAVVILSSTARVLGKMTATIDPETGGANRVDNKGDILTALANGYVLVVEPAFDFSAPIMPVRSENGMQFSKNPVMTPLDFTTSPTPFYTKAEAVIFLKDMHERDQRSYKDMIRSTMRAVEQQARALSAQQAGIAMPGAPGGQRS